MELRSVIFDFGGVVCFPPTDQQIDLAAQACNLAAPDFLRAFWANRIDYDAGELGPYAYWSGVAKATDRTFNDELIAQMIRREIDFWSRYDDRVLAWAKELRSQGYRIGLLSNLPRPLGHHLRSSRAFLAHFDHLTLSYELRLVKPHAAIYEDAMRGLGVAPEQTLFLDDRADNVEGARAVGMHAELFVSWEQFLETMPSRYGLPVPDVARRQ
jgi:putative hydrolase of the HAD superfamily